MLVYVTCELFAAFMCISSHAGSARKEKKRLLSIINRHLKHTPVFVGLLVQWLLRYVNLIAAGRMSDEVICFRCCCFFGLSTEIFGARYLYVMGNSTVDYLIIGKIFMISTVLAAPVTWRPTCVAQSGHQWMPLGNMDSSQLSKHEL